MKNLESNIQITCVDWFRRLSPWRLDDDVQRMFFSVPNGGHRNYRTAAIMKAEGVMRGVADILLLVPKGKYHDLCIEMKTPSRSSGQSDYQIEWQQSAEKFGYEYVVCRCFDDFERVVTSYMSQE